MAEPSGDLLCRLARVIAERRGSQPEVSYVAGLLARGEDALLKKVGEEAAELIIAAKGGASAEIVHETADLWFHTLVMLEHYGLGPEDVLAELERRFGESGLEEKARR